MATMVASAYVELSARTAALEAGLARANAQLTAYSKKADATAARSNAAMMNLGRAAKIGAGAVAVGLAASVKVAATFEKQMSQVKAVTGATGAQYERLASSAKSLGASTKFSAREVAAAQVELGKAGMSVSQILGGGLKASLALAAAGDMELAAAAATVSDALGVFKMRAADATQVADAMASAANMTTADVAEFSMGLENAGGSAKAAGMDFNATMTALTLLAKAGTKGAEAGTNIKSFLANITSPSTKAAGEMKRLGVSFFDAKGNIKSLSDISGMLKRSLAGMTKEQKLSTANLIAGAYGAKTFLALMNAAPGAIEKYSTELAKSGSAAKVAQVMNDNFSGKLEQLKGSLETLGISVGETFLPALTAAAGGLSNFIEKFPMVKQLAVAAAAALVAFGAALAVGKVIAFGKALKELRMVQMGGQIASTIGSVGLAFSQAALGVGRFGNTATVFDKHVASVGRFSQAATFAKTSMGGLLSTLAPNPWIVATAAVGTLAAVTLPAIIRSFQGGASAADQYVQAMGRIGQGASALKTTIPSLVPALDAVTAATKRKAAAQRAADADPRSLQKQAALKQAIADEANARDAQVRGLQKTAVAARQAADAGAAQVGVLTKSAAAYGLVAPGSDAARRAVDKFRIATDMAGKKVGDKTPWKNAQASYATLALELSKMPAKYSRAAEMAKKLSDMKPGPGAKAMADSLVKELDRVTGAAKKKIPGVTVKVKQTGAQKAQAEIDAFIAKVQAADGKSATATITTRNVTVNETRTVRAMGGMVGFAGGGTVRGPGGTDKVPAMLTAGEVVLTKEQQRLVDSGTSIQQALRQTGGVIGGRAFATGGTVNTSALSTSVSNAQSIIANVKVYLNIADVKKAAQEAGIAVSGATNKILEGYRKRLAALTRLAEKQQSTEGISQTAINGTRKKIDAVTAAIQRQLSKIQQQTQAMSALKQRIADAYATGVLAKFDKATQSITDSIRREFEGYATVVNGVVTHVTGAFEQIQSQTEANLKSIERNFAGTWTDIAGQVRSGSFKDFERALDAAMKRIQTKYDALTPAEAQLKVLQDAGSAESLGNALTDAQAKLAEAQRWGDPQQILDAQRALAEAQRQLQIAELTKTAETERSAVEEQRQAAITATQDYYDAQRLALQDQLDGQLAAERLAGEDRLALARADMESRVGVVEEERARLRTSLEGQLEEWKAHFMKMKIATSGNSKSILATLRRFVAGIERSGVALGSSFADGMKAAIPNIGAAANEMAAIVAKYLELHSPADKGPLSRLDTFWTPFADTLVSGLDDTEIRRAMREMADVADQTQRERVAREVSAQAAYGISTAQAHASSNAAVFNLTVSDNTLSGMSREQADRVAREVQAAIERQVSYSIS